MLVNARGVPRCVCQSVVTLHHLTRLCVQEREQANEGDEADESEAIKSPSYGRGTKRKAGSSTDTGNKKVKTDAAPLATDGVEKAEPPKLGQKLGGLIGKKRKQRKQKRG